MKLKCIGGECDGEMIDVSDNLKIYDFVRVKERPKPATLDLSINAVVKYYVYKISYFNFSKDDKYMFLLPEGWTDKQAIIHQFNK